MSAVSASSKESELCNRRGCQTWAKYSCRQGKEDRFLLTASGDALTDVAAAFFAEGLRQTTVLTIYKESFL